MSKSDQNLLNQEHLIYRQADVPRKEVTYANRKLPSYSMEDLQDVFRGKQTDLPLSSDEALLMYLKQAEDAPMGKSSATLGSAARKLMAEVTPHYVELIVVADEKFCALWKSRGKDVNQYVREIINAVDNQYKVQGPKAGFQPIRILLTEIIQWADGNPIIPTEIPSSGYKQKIL